MALSLCFLGCQQNTNTWSKQLFKNDKLVIDIAYESKAAPYKNYGDTLASVFTITSLNELLKNHEIKVQYPSDSAMINLDWITERNYTKSDIKNLANRIVNRPPQVSQIKLLFLNGYYTQENRVQKDVLGINIDNTSIVAIFKPVVQTSSQNRQIRTLIEQCTITHEIGHAIGLVNTKIKEQSKHSIIKNGAHCTNSNCVMYWQNNEAAVLNFIRQDNRSPFNLFGEQCMIDVKEK